MHRTCMRCLFVFLLLSTALVAQSATVLSVAHEELPPANAFSIAPDLLRAPGGMSSVIGGEIRNVDPVRDQFTLKAFGGQAMKVLYDERTQVYRDGTKISVLSLKADDHASVDTTLDGAAIFALRVHLLSHVPIGEARGQVESYNPETGELRMDVAVSNESFNVHVAAGTPIVRIDQIASSPPGGSADIARGTLVDVKFKLGRGGHGEATHIDVVALIGSAFVFRGDVSSLDVKAGRFVITNRNNRKTQDIAFDPTRFPASRNLHEGSSVRVTARFDGTQYVANEIVVD
jgi:Domain of unknown function (DUF5666)